MTSRSARPARFRAPAAVARLALAAVMFASAAVAPAAAQDIGFMKIRVGQTVSGELNENSPVLADGTRFVPYSLTGRSGERVTITLRAPGYDAWLRIGRMQNGQFQLVEYNDDGAGGRDSRLTYTFPSDGDLIIQANCVSKNSAGSYTLSVEAAGSAPVVASSSEGARQIRAGETLQGELEENTPRLTDGTRYVPYVYKARAGERVTITLRSAAYDAWLRIGRMENGAFKLIEYNDDAAGGHDAQITYTVPSDGELIIHSNAVSKSAVGPYTLMVQSARGGSSSSASTTRPSTGSGSARSSRPAPTPVGPIAIGEAIDGELSSSDYRESDDSFADYYRLEARRGDRLVITLRSDDFDAYLVFGKLTGGSFEQIESDDDAAGGTDAQVEITIPADGVYLIRANTLSEGETGKYQLKVLRAR
jgi:hypothetical protein